MGKVNRIEKIEKIKKRKLELEKERCAGIESPGKKKKINNETPKTENHIRDEEDEEILEILTNRP